MKQVTIDNKIYVLEYTFNSIRYMDDLNFNELQNIEETPLSFIPLLQNCSMED